MFGTYRFVLASLVALSHYGMNYAGFNPGQWAVISFYTLSGLLMERQHSKLGAANFYLDRLLRIYPIYIAVLWLAWLGHRITWPATLANLALLPMNYTDFFPIPTLILNSWSLACEVHFYLLVPLLVLCSTQILRWIASLSLLLFLISPLLPHSAFWAYGGLPGILFTFMSGMLINRKDFSFIKKLWVTTTFFLALFCLSKWFYYSPPCGININICIGYLIATVAIPWLDRFSFKARWDRIAGLFSFPLFLCNQLIPQYAQHYFPAPNPLVLLAWAIGFSSILIFAIEIPFDWLRHKLRKN